MAEKLLLKDMFNRTNIHIYTDHNNTTKHINTGAVDYSHGVYPVYAPCDLKLIYSPEINTTNSLANTNTLMFQSVNDIEFADPALGVGKLCISFGHMRDDEYGDEYDHSLNVASWYAGQVFEKGQIIYYEGDKGGGSTGVHVHVRLGKGNFISPWRSISEPSGNVILNTSSTTPLKHDQVFFKDQVNISYGAYAYASNFNWRTTSDNNTTDPTDPVTSTGVYLQGVSGGFYIRETAGSGAIKTTVSAGENAEILEFIPGFIYSSTDNKYYQWAKVKKGTIEGYAQLDLHEDYKIVCDSTFDPIYLRAVGSYFNIRSQKNTTSTILGTVAAGSRIELIAISSTHESGGYQWARVNYNGQVGFVQIDTVGFNQLEF